MISKPSFLAAILLAPLAAVGVGGCLPGAVTPSADGTYSVSSAAELRSALEAAASDGRPSRIELAPGEYATGGTPFAYQAVPTEAFGLEIVGAGATTTVLDGGGLSSVLTIELVGVAGDAKATVRLHDLTIEGGRATDRAGAGLYVAASAAPVTIERARFLRNQMESDGGDALGGGAYLVTAEGNVAVRDAQFEGNAAVSTAGQANGAGLAVIASGASIEVARSTFAANAGHGSFAARGAGAFLLSQGAGTLDVHDATFTGNQNTSSDGLAASAGLEARSLNVGAITIARCRFERNALTGLVAANGAGAVGIVAAGALSFLQNALSDNGGTSHSGSAFGGGAYLLSTTSGPLVVDGNRFTGNLVQGDDALGVRGGGASVESEQQGKIVLTNNVVSDNAALSELGFATAGGVFASAFFEGDIDVTHNTFFRNETTGDGGALVVAGLSVINVFSNVLFENGATDGSAPDVLAIDSRGGSLGSIVRLVRNRFDSAVSACEGSTVCTPRVTREANLASDPRFVDAPGGDFRLASGSPAIDAGTPDAPSLPPTDGAGHARVIGAAPDLGAIETGCGRDVTSQVAMATGGFRLRRETRRFAQEVTLTNTGTSPLEGPLALVVSGISPTVALGNASAETACAAPLGRGVVGVDLGGTQTLAPGASATVVLEFANPNALSIAYEARVLSGAF